MSLFEKFQQIAEQGQAAAAKAGDFQRALEGEIRNFFLELQKHLDFPPKNVNFVDLDDGRAYPLPLEEARPTIQVVPDPKSGETLFYAAVELKLPDTRIGVLPVWVRVLFRYTKDGITATVADRTVPIPKDTEALVGFAAELIEKSLAGGAVPIVKIGF